LLMKLYYPPRRLAVRSIVAVYAVLFVQPWILPDVLDVNRWLGCECGTGVGAASRV
jgi:hypothetical protein